MRRLLPILMILLGLGGGVAAGLVMKPAHKPLDERSDDAEAGSEEADGSSVAEKESDPDKSIPDPGTVGSDAEVAKAEDPKERSYVMIGKQTIVPVVEGQKTRALMLFELAVDIDASAHDLAVLLEPRLRDAFLRELLRMSSTGAFTKTYTEDWVIEELRRNLSGAARQYLGDSLKEVLILDVIRQEM